MIIRQDCTVEQARAEFVSDLNKNGYTYIRTDWKAWQGWDVLRLIPNLRKPQFFDKRRINDIIVFCDTETSKDRLKITAKKLHIKKGNKRLTANRFEANKQKPRPNHLVCWTITLRAWHTNFVTLTGRKPSEFAKCIQKIHGLLKGTQTLMFFHNLGYDWTFLERYIIRELGEPENQLNTKPHYPVSIEFENGITLRDSLILLQRRLEKVGEDLGVEHQKAVGDWDYNVIRDQDTPLTEDEWHYAEFDTLCGAECIDAYMTGLGVNLARLPYTSTGSIRSDVRRLAAENKFHDKLMKMALDYDQYCILHDKVFHGGFTHANRHYTNMTITGETKCYDFCSSYPYIICAYKMPMGKFAPCKVTVDDILESMETMAYFGRLTIINPDLKPDKPMPYLQYSKCETVLNATTDNGRILKADCVEIWVTEFDLAIIKELYDGIFIMSDTQTAFKDYLPRWFTDYVFGLFHDKCTLKGGDPVIYALKKAKLNGNFGMTVQSVIREIIEEDYAYTTSNPDKLDPYTSVEPATPKEEYEKAMSRQTMVLNYAWGVWICAIGCYNLFQLGKCAGLWIYSDTDSGYGQDWNEQKLAKYNRSCLDKLLLNGYNVVEHNGKTFCLGVAEHEGDKDTYTEYKVQGAKRYCGRCKADGELHITVAGVPKKDGAKCLNDDIKNFHPGFIFDGRITQKKMHTYYYDEIHTDAHGNECSNSIDLTYCNYELDSSMVTLAKDHGSIDDYIESILNDEVNIIVYDQQAG